MSGTGAPATDPEAFAVWLDAVLAGTGITGETLAAVAVSGRVDAAAGAVGDGWAAGCTGLLMAAIDSGNGEAGCAESGAVGVVS